MVELIGFFVVIGALIFVIIKQQRIIDDLNDRVMARDFTDYVNGSRAREDPQPGIPSRKPKSWYDDPNIPDGDDT